MNQLLSLGLCETEGVLRTFKIINISLTIIKIIVPLLIIIMGMVDLFKVVTAGQDEEMKKSINILVKRIIAGLVIFMLPSIMNAIFDLNTVKSSEASDYAGCETCLTNSEECNTLIEVAKINERDQLEKNAANYAMTQEEYNAWREKMHKNNKKNNGNTGQTTGTGGTGYTQDGTGIDYNYTDPVQRMVAQGKYFDSTDVTKISGLTEQEFINVLQNSTAYKGKAKIYIPYAKDLIRAEHVHGVNAFYLIGLYSLESGWLKSALTQQCNNIGGVRYYNQTYSGNKKVTQCLGYAGFDSIPEFIDFHATLLETKYLTPGASHYYGTSVADVAKDYGHGNGINTIIEIANNVATK